MRKLCFLVVFATVAITSRAGTQLQVGAGKAYTTIQSAVDVAENGDTILLSGGTYNESVQLINKNNLTLTADAEATITAPTGQDALYLRNCEAFSLKGASATQHLFLVSTSTGNGAPGTALNAVWSLAPNLLVEDVEFRGVAGTFAVTCGASNGEPITFNRCRFKVDHSWSTVCVEGKGVTTFNDCNWDKCEGIANALRFSGTDPGIVRLNRCNIVGHNGPSTEEFPLSNWCALTFDKNSPTGPATIEATDCHFGNYFYVYDDNGDYPDTATQVNADRTIRLINPTFGITEPQGHVFRTTTGVHCIIQGKNAIEKTDLRNSMLLFSNSEVLNGTVSFQDCIMHKAQWFDVCVSLQVQTKGPKVVNFERCLFPADGTIITEGATVGTGESTINIKNSIIEAKPEANAQIINTSMGSKETVNLTHVTLYPGLNSYGVDMMTGSSNDVLNANHCILDGLGENSIHHDIKLNGTKNIVRNADGFNFGGTAPVQPADTIVADPKINDLTAHLLEGSPAINAATGSTEIIDYDGEARPYGAGVDIGADEQAPLPPNEWADFPATQSSVAPVIDGTINDSEWPTKALAMNHYNMTTFRGTRLYSPGATLDSDFSGTYWFMWDQNYLYIAARISDNEVDYLLNAGQALNGTDVVQLCLDHQNARSSVVSDGVYVHDFAPGQKDNHNVAAYYQHWPEGARNTFPNTTVAGRTTTTGYEIEARLKWTDMTPNPIAPAVGVQMGYLTMLLDVDGGQVKDLWTNAGGGTNVIENPSQYNTLTLIDAPVPPVNAVHGWALFE